MALAIGLKSGLQTVQGWTFVGSQSVTPLSHSSHVEMFASLTSIWLCHILWHHYFSIVLALCETPWMFVYWWRHNIISECKKCQHGCCLKGVLTTRPPCIVKGLLFLLLKGSPEVEYTLPVNSVCWIHKHLKHLTCHRLVVFQAS